MSHDGPPAPRRRLLDPVDRASEVLFGLIMVLTFTGSLSAAEAGREEIRTMLLGALGCNLAWGIVDAAMFLMASLTERGRGLRTLQALRRAEPQHGRQIVAGALPPVVASILSGEQLEAMRQLLVALPAPPPRARFVREDWLGALAVFLLVFLATFPVVIPFLLMQHAVPALRASNAIAIVILFFAGSSLGRHAGQSPWRTGLVMVLAGLALVGITIALGG